MPSKNEKKKAKKTTGKGKKMLGKITAKDIEARVTGEAEASGKTEQEVLDEIFGDGWLTVMIEESGTAHIDASQLYKKKKAEKSTIAECKRLRNTFAPVAACVNHVKKQLLAGGIEVIIDNLKDKHQVDVKERITKFISDVHQDRYTRGLFTILAIMVDLALTTGVSAAEICFDLADLDFWKYAEIDEEAKQQILIAQKKKRTTAEYILIKTREPDWKDLKGIIRLKIANNVFTRFKLYRDPKTWEAKYWSVDEPKQKKGDEIVTNQGIRISLKTFRPEKPNVNYFHPWQIFWLNLNRKDYSERSESIITEVLSSALLLEKILKAVGEGIYRAGNKKYFIICGTEKRRWSDRYIRNMLQQLKEASQKNWSTIPAPAGFDIKDIGGEVFEAENVVEYFKKILARGMKVPASVLGVEVRNEPHYNYEIMREQLRMAIEHQLFETHLWCNFGKVRGKQGGKSSKSIYVPKSRFKDEVLLSFPDRIELLFKGFNVANPFNPLIKLKAESEYCRLMGWDDVILPTQEEYAKEIEDAKKEEEARAAEKEKLKEKRQGEPVPQTKERQEKRREGMTDKHPEKGKVREQGETRKPKEVQESVPQPPQEVLIKVVTESKPTDIVVKTPLDGLMADLVKKQQEKVDLEKNLAEEEGKRKQKKLQKEIDKTEGEIEEIKARIEKVKKETEKIRTESEEIVKTEEEKRKTMKKIQDQVEKEEKLIEGESGSEE